MHPESHAYHAKRMSHHVISCVHATRPDANPHDTAPRHARGMPAACLKHARSPQPATQTRQKCARRHTQTLKHGRSPQPATRKRQKCARHHTQTLAVHAAPQRERRYEQDFRTGPRFRKSCRCHPAALIEEFRKAREKDSGEIFWSIKTMYLDHVCRLCIKTMCQDYVSRLCI